MLCKFSILHFQFSRESLFMYKFHYYVSYELVCVGQKGLLTGGQFVCLFTKVFPQILLPGCLSPQASAYPGIVGPLYLGLT